MSDPIALPPQKPQPDARGWLCFEAPLPDDLQRAEDSTQEHDTDGWSPDRVFGFDAETWSSYFDRRATDAEKTLLAALGYTVPDDLTTRVSFPSPLVRRRRWPALENQEVTP